MPKTGVNKNWDESECINIHTCCVWIFLNRKCGMPSFYRCRQTHWKPISQMRSEAGNEYTRSRTGWKQLIAKTNHSKRIFNIIFTVSHRSTMQINKLIQLRIDRMVLFHQYVSSRDRVDPSQQNSFQRNWFCICQMAFSLRILRNFIHNRAHIKP